VVNQVYRGEIWTPDQGLMIPLLYCTTVLQDGDSVLLRYLVHVYNDEGS
jgi:hypothetical protein